MVIGSSSQPGLQQLYHLEDCAEPFHKWLFNSGFIFYRLVKYLWNQKQIWEKQNINQVPDSDLSSSTVLISSSVSDLLWKSHTRPSTALPSARPQRHKNKERTRLFVSRVLLHSTQTAVCSHQTSHTPDFNTSSAQNARYSGPILTCVHVSFQEHRGYSGIKLHIFLVYHKSASINVHKLNKYVDKFCFQTVDY